MENVFRSILNCICFWLICIEVTMSLCCPSYEYCNNNIYFHMNNNKRKKENWHTIVSSDSLSQYIGQSNLIQISIRNSFSRWPFTSELNVFIGNDSICLLHIFVSDIQCSTISCLMHACHQFNVQYIHFKFSGKKITTTKKIQSKYIHNTNID